MMASAVIDVLTKTLLLVLLLVPQSGARPTDERSSDGEFPSMLKLMCYRPTWAQI